MGEEERKRRAGERGGEVRLPHSKFLDPPLDVKPYSINLYTNEASVQLMRLNVCCKTK